MPTVGVDIEVFGAPVIRRMFVGAGERALDARPAFRKIARILERSTRANFATKGASSGARWPDLEAATVAAKRRSQDPKVRANAERVLRATDHLMNSLVKRGDSDHVEEVGLTSLRWGSRVGYGVYHESLASRTVIPHRPPVRLSEVDKRLATRELQRFIVGHR